MSAQLRSLDELPKRNSTQVKNNWSEVLRQVQQAGSIAITRHLTIEMVMISAGAYREMVDLFTELRARERRAKLDDLKRRFDERLAVLRQREARERLDAMLAGRGKLAKGKRPLAGDPL
ncbi:type II toxin-antitoxin system Phd/YefM family antitoxin [Steroidobacter sp.]|uniref:type II toxin-antitoxin system Phd/YefM family antitoxin n=1 Tax=Steroidobacter sp. TaxID=1978227 RepID=UPI001A5018BD|nr:type II toxin-antitoxin system Phd/YefM family antitoxin [Steroidobacter sp.]MBL8266433.1 type II toxin-antitoxin system Phd/YefM family antitoxin [Steroidobacter sp.]